MVDAAYSYVDYTLLQRDTLNLEQVDFRQEFPLLDKNAQYFWLDLYTYRGY